MAFQWLPLQDSTALAGAVYDEQKKILIVSFVGGQRYMYMDVPPEDVEQLVMEQDSVGSEFYYGIRKDTLGTTRYARMEF